MYFNSQPKLSILNSPNDIYCLSLLFSLWYNQDDMETTEKFKLLDCIGKLYENSEKCKLEENFFIENDMELSLLSDYFGVSKTQSFFIIMVFTINLKGDTVDFNDLNKHFDCNP